MREDSFLPNENVSVSYGVIELNAKKGARKGAFTLMELLVVVALSLSGCFGAYAAPFPYGVDSDTLHLWHLDEPDAPSMDAVPGGINLLVRTNGATLNNASFTGFGAALSTLDGGQNGILGSQRNAYLAPLALVNGAGDNVAMAYDNSTNGAFTFEAIVRVDFDPALDMGSGGTGRNSAMQIISGDGDANAERLFQWRLVPVGVAAGGSDASVPRLEFINIRQGAAVENLIVPVPTNGLHTITSNGWYHVAVAYNGSENTASNLAFFWTQLEANVSSANLIGTESMANDLSAGVTFDFVVGNEGRDSFGSTDNWIGLIDEVRISSVARMATEFIFPSLTVLQASSWQEPNVPDNTLDDNLGTRWSALGDGEWITYDLGRLVLVSGVEIAFYLGNTRTSNFDVLVSADSIVWQTKLTNAVSSGTTSDLELFEFVGTAARYVRIVGHGNSESLWNSLTEVTVRSAALGDSDIDGLPDVWEIAYFTNITAFAGGDDPDTDLFNNTAEYQGGSNPTNSLSTPSDIDADSLPDAWETTWFSSLVYGPLDDPDKDDFTNAEELAAGTNPDNAASNLDDSDADGLPDTWEMLYFLSLNEGPFGDFDRDGFNNLEEYQWDSLPNNGGSVPENVFVRYFPIDDGDTNTSEYGYGGSSAINAVAFIRSALITEGGQQFIAYYGRHQTDPSYTFNNTIWIGRRTLGTNGWEVFRTAYTANNINDGHDVVSFAFDGDGYLHMSWGMHGDDFHYSRSTTPVTGSQPIVMGPDSTMTGNENAVTYPQWLALPNGDLLFLFREGASGNGDTFLNRYDTATETWTNVHRNGSTQLPFIKGTGWSPNYNAYPNMPCLDAEGNLILTWTWRYQGDSPAGESGYQTNHDFDYAESTDGGLTWQRQDGTPYTLPISEFGENGDPNTTAEKVVSIPEGYSLINQAGMCLDSQGQPVIASWWAAGTGTNNYRRQYRVTFVDSNGVWQVRQVSHRTRDSEGTKHSESTVRDLGRPVVICDEEDRIIVLYRDNEGANGLTLVHSLPQAEDPDREVWVTFDLTSENLGNYEPVIDVARWERDGVLSILHQPSSGNGYTAPANNASPIGVLEWDAGAYFKYQPDLGLNLVDTNAVLSFHGLPSWGYRLRSTETIADWPSLGTWSNTNGTVVFEHEGGAEGPQRLWRLDYKEAGIPAP